MPQPVKLTPGKPPKDDVAKESTFEVPPSASMPEGVTGHLPVPPGRVEVAHIGAGNPDEPQVLRDLRRVGWKPGMDIPKHMQEEVEAALAAANVEIAEGSMPQQPPANSKPIELNTKNIEDLPPEKQQEVNQAIKEALQPPQPPQTEKPKSQPLPPPDPSSALDEIMKAKTIPDKPKAADGKREDAMNVVTADDLPETSDTGVEHAMSNCPHCQWDLSLPDPVEPVLRDKHDFLQAVLGFKPFHKAYSLMGDRVQMIFRTLTTREIDACYQQLYRERDRGEIRTELDFVERITRLRLYLQLQRVIVTAGTGADHDLPDGLSKQANPHAEAYWDFPEDEEEPLKLIEKHLLDNVLTTETLGRVAMQHSSRFNRLVSKLEAMVDDENFWKATP